MGKLAKEKNCIIGKHMELVFAAILLFQAQTLWADSDTQIPDSDSAADTEGGVVDTAPTASTPTESAAPEPAPAPVSPREPAPLKNEIPKDKMPDVKVTVSPKKGAIGDLIEWKVTVTKKTAADRVVLPTSFDFGNLEIQNRTLAGQKEDEDAMTQVLGIGLVSFETGDFEIPPQKLTVVDADGNLSEVMSPAFKVKITSLIANAPEPAIKVDDKDGEVVMVEDYTLLYVAIGLGAVVLIVALTLLVRKLLSMRKPKPGPPPPPPRPAHEIALEKLNELRKAGYLDEQMHKTFHLKLSEAVRDYLGNRYGFDALERSTHEIVSELRARSLKVDVHREIVQLLEDTDLVKFAKYIPAKETSEHLLDEAFRIVDVTRERQMPSSSTGRMNVEKVDGGHE